MRIIHSVPAGAATPYWWPLKSFPVFAFLRDILETSLPASRRSVSPAAIGRTSPSPLCKAHGRSPAKQC